MTKQEFIHGGLKLIGFWLLITGILSLVSSISTGTSIYFAVADNPNIHLGFWGCSSSCPTVSSHGAPSLASGESLEQMRMTMQWCKAQGDCLFAILKISFAFYLCRGGSMIVRFLMGKTTESPSDSSASSEAASR